MICRIDDSQLIRVPAQGPLIIVINHVNILEIPIIFTHLQPRPVTGFVASKRWKSRWTRWLMETSGAIPLRRGTADISAIRKGIEMLNNGAILIIAPEGTRSKDGCLQKGHPGVVTLALKSKAPLLPIVFHGAENWMENVRHLKRTNFHIVVGKPFHLRTKGKRVTSEIRRQIIDEIMYQLANLLPSRYWGEYHNKELATEEYLSFEQSNIHSAHPTLSLS